MSASHRALATLALCILGNGACFAAPPVFLDAQFDPLPGPDLVQTERHYRVRVFQSVDVRDLTLRPPAAPLTEIRPLPDGPTTEVLRDGVRYRVREWRYAVRPLASGPLTMNGAVLQGQVAAPTGDGRHRWQALSLEAPSVSRVIQPLPAGSLLAARNLQLSEAWSPAPTGQTAIGQVFTRTIRITASGIRAEQLPALTVRADGASVHAEAARLENRQAGDFNHATREQVFTIIVRQTGPIELAALSVPWWNLATAERAHASLPAQALQVAPADAKRPQVPAAKQKAPDGWGWAGGVTVLLGIAALYRQRPRIRGHWEIRRAWRSGNPHALADALLDWVALQGLPRPATLLELGRQLSRHTGMQAAQDALQALDRALYGPPHAPGHPSELRRWAVQIGRGISALKQRTAA